MFDFYSDGYGEVVTFLEDTVVVRRPKDARDSCRSRGRDSKHVTLRSHRRSH
jgi:hypothetical protein